MAWSDLFGSRSRKRKRQVEKIVSQSAKRAITGLPREKQTLAKWEKQFFMLEGTISRDEMRSKDAMDALRIIRDLNPDSSMAMWNFLRIGNTGHTLEVVKADGSIDQAGTNRLNELAPRIGKLYGGGTDQLINVLFLTSYTQGAVALEVEVEENIEDVVDFHAVDPSSLEFRRNKETKEIELGQVQTDGQFKVLNPNTVFYQPLDPDISDPYGRSPMLPILQIVFFQVEVMRSLQKVINHQGFERFDIEVVESAIMENLPPHIANGEPQQIADFVQSFVDNVHDQMASLEPDSDFVHPDSVKIKSVGGSKNATVNAEAVVKIINQQVVTALKQLPILLGRNEGTTETHGTVQWQVFISGIEAIRQGIKRLLERAYNVALQVYGIQGRARITFNELRAEDELKAAQTEETKTNTKIAQVNQGWISNDQAAEELVGHPAVSAPLAAAPATASDALAAFRPTASSRTELIKMLKDRGYMEPGKDQARKADETDAFFLAGGESWSDEVAEIARDAEDAYSRFLAFQREIYLENLRNAPEPPGAGRKHADRQAGTRADDWTDEFEEWFKDWIQPEREEQLSFWDDLGLDWMAQAAFKAGELSFLEFDTAEVFNFTDELMLRWLSNRARREAELIQGATDFDVLMSLWDVVAEGQYSIDKASSALQDSYGFSERRARVIARTEIISAGRCGQFTADTQSGMVIGKVWQAADQEDRTRPGHKDADGQTVPLDEPFSVANKDGQLEMLLFPGDDSLGATASNLIQCRCWYKRILEGEEDQLGAG